jgi:YjbE family integral membrane protein
MTLDYLGSILKIILFDLVLSGDNAVVIGLAAHLLPSRQRRQAMLWGCGMAIVMRLALTLVVAHLLLFPGLRFAGAVLLAWIACKLIQEQADSTDQTMPPPTSLLKAITRIAMADFIMSLDNVVAIAGASQADPVRIILGLFLSISMLLLLSAVIVEIMNRYRWIAYLGTAVLALTAADLMVQDFEFFYRTRMHQGADVAYPRWAAWTVRISILVLCLTTKRWWPDGRARPAEGAVDKSAHSLEKVLDQAPLVFEASAPEPVAAANRRVRPKFRSDP